MTKMEPGVDPTTLFIPMAELKYEFDFERKAREDRQKWRELIESVAYKSNWKLEYLEDGNRIKVTMHVPDSRCEDEWKRELIPVWAIFDLGPFINREYAICCIRDIIRNLELHEIDEWLKVDGELVNDPHADIASKA